MRQQFPPSMMTSDAPAAHASSTETAALVSSGITGAAKLDEGLRCAASNAWVCLHL